MSDESARQQQVAGVWCSEVLERLPDLVDGALSAEETARIRAHVAGCAWCERFGGTYAALVRALRDSPEPEPPEGLSDRLQRALRVRTVRTGSR